MKWIRKDLSEEMHALRRQLKALLDERMGEKRRSRILLRDTERKVEDLFATMDSIQSPREEAARKFRKIPTQAFPTAGA